jgi:4-hydroxy-2-oxoheptanedioate aldolase
MDSIDMHPGARFRRRLRNGDRLFGTLTVSSSPRWMEVLRGCGLDFLFIDTEHVALDRTEVSWMCQAFGAIGLPPLLRIPSPDPYEATMALDAGAAGVIVPYVETAAQARELAGAVRMRPIRGERLRRMLAGEAAEPALAEYVQRLAEPRLLILNIESTPALAALDEILAVEGPDAVLVGPHDLSCSMGIPECYDDPEFLAACGTIFRKARAAGLGAGIHADGEPARFARFLELGANMIVFSSDVALFGKYVRSGVAEIRRLSGMTEGAEAGGTGVTAI